MRKLSLCAAFVGFSASVSFALDDETTVRDVILDTDESVLIASDINERGGTVNGNLLSGKQARFEVFSDLMPYKVTGPFDVDF